MTGITTFIERTLGGEMTSYQKDIADLLLHHRKVAVTAPMRSRKTSLASWVALWGAGTASSHTRTVVTAPNVHLLKSILWESILTWNRRADWRPYGIITSELGQMAIQMNTHSRLSGVLPHNTSEMLSAFGSRVVIVFDEADGISPHMWDAALATFENASVEAYFLAIGTPRQGTGYFRDIFEKNESGWVKYHVPLEEVFRAGFITFEEIHRASIRLGGENTVEFYNNLFGLYYPGEITYGRKD